MYPITRVIIKTDLTEEEVYLVILQLLEKLKINFGHTIECTKSILTVYLIFEVSISFNKANSYVQGRMKRSVRD